MSKLAGKTAIITGASRGIGAEIARQFAANGAKVVVNYSGSQEKAEAVVADIQANGGEAIAVKANVSDSESVKAMVDGAMKTFGSVDILVNNAGITRDNLMMRMKDDEWDDVINTNLKGVFVCTKAVTRQMMKQRAGRIINIASIVGVMGNAGQANYVASKAGVIGLTKTTARELASRGITANAVAPGFITTDMTDQLTEDVQKAMLGQIPLGRFGAPEDVAKAALFLASDDASYMTGQTLHLDGGMVM
ncbi:MULTISPECIES: 3-oxoacyl-[acyl-carrier-protein] reductase [Planococcus]|uniref:3-oxoacyl-[acyl-carrier-protein] reductase n=1 Tax=Planococcus wigleyi TaxID=2762216 RepID=A0ABR8W9W7_9BACL|nr:MULTISPECIES: 3-oxoacyl-[acyl-carrier-protein] reductase [Planococcus]MBD8013825.1 3-oxoacyl-[acyl-carrier-protein] reductase [Planococcus wigleyi]MBF6634141.1 3-oxoacyl-[acyl-carrier-protein] reductase [Planococcus sp. (in: firmicutes)]MDN3437722.1 3-oxoacyl-[acyl-carrier-protein] reductase [Planococcus sp. APC 3900]